MEECVRVYDSDYCNIPKVKSFGNHLCTNEYIGFSCREVVYESFISGACSCGVEVHPCDACLRDVVKHLVFNLLCSDSAVPVVFFLTCRTLGGEWECVSAVVTCKLIGCLVPCEGNVALCASWCPSAVVALYLSGISSAILEDDDLLFVFYCLSHGVKQGGGE